MDMGPVISAHSVRKSFGSSADKVVALDGVSLDVSAGEFVVLLGRSGCGKSTLLSLLGGLQKPDAGTIEVGGIPVDGPGLDRGLMFQSYAVFPWRTVRGNIVMGLAAKKVPRREHADRVDQLLQTVGLEGRGDSFPYQLSGGMKQRVALGRLLATDAEVLLMDEPFGALDEFTRTRLHGDLLSLWRETGKTILFVTHNVREAVLLGTRVVIMEGDPGRIKTDIAVNCSYPRDPLGEDVVSLERQVVAALGDEE